jgi:hypothetical protein
VPSSLRGGPISGGLSESLLLELLELLLDELPPESPGSLGGGVVGNGLSVAAGLLAGAGPGASGVLADLAGSPGNGNCSAVEGLFVPAAGGVQGLGGGGEDGWF